MMLLIALSKHQEPRPGHGAVDGRSTSYLGTAPARRRHGQARPAGNFVPLSYLGQQRLLEGVQFQMIALFPLIFCTNLFSILHVLHGEKRGQQFDSYNMCRCIYE